MNLLMLNYEYPPLGGGAANATAHILKEFASVPDLRVDLVTSSTGEGRVEQITDNIAIHFLDIGKRGDLHYQTNKDLLAYSWKCYRHAKRLRVLNRYDLCHAFFGIPCGFIAWRLGLPYIVSLRGSDVPFYNERFKVLDKMIFRRLSRTIWRDAEAVVANSEGLRQLALSTAPSQHIHVIPNGVDTAMFSPSSTPEHQGDAEGREIRILCVSRLIGRKRIDLLIEALSRIPNSTVTLSLVGTGNKEDELRQLANDEKLGKRVRFLGFVEHDRLPELYRSHDLFVLPSVNEGMSNTVLEAMASGLPIVMTRTGGAEELVTNGRNGRLIEKDSVKSILEAIEFYLETPGALKQHGRMSRLKAETMSWKSVAERYLEIYYGNQTNG